MKDKLKAFAQKAGKVLSLVWALLVCLFVFAVIVAVLVVFAPAQTACVCGEVVS